MILFCLRTAVLRSIILSRLPSTDVVSFRYQEACNSCRGKDQSSKGFDMKIQKNRILNTKFVLEPLPTKSAVRLCFRRERAEDAIVSKSFSTSKYWTIWHRSMRLLHHHRKEQSGKLSPRWRGPFEISGYGEVMAAHALCLSYLDARYVAPSVGTCRRTSLHALGTWEDPTQSIFHRSTHSENQIVG